MQVLTNAPLREYQARGFSNVQGWCGEALFEIVDLLNSLNFNQGGGVCEIGVHHGKFYLLLNQVTEAEDSSFAIDLFEDQSLNIDKSGMGSADAFRANLNLYDVHQGRNTTLISADSTDSHAVGELLEKIGRGSIRFFSIDGGHTARHTINDLNLANLLTKNSGVVILDDVLNHHWLGVFEGVVKFLLSEPTLIPFAIGYNKLFLCKLSYHEKYLLAFQQSPLRQKVVDFLGSKLVAL
jgi:hypothetical protein